MAFDDYGNPMDDMMWQDEDSAGPENDDFGDVMFNNPAGFRRGGGYGMNNPRFFGGREFGPPGPRYMWGRGFGPAGPPVQMRYPRENKPLRYLIRCGVPKQNLKGLPDALLRLLEPQYCGICAQGFDNFTLSRLHYISKNHFKNQKKWLAQQAEVGCHRPREIPLKSRDLYCELCDVHITSKTHAESHYAGRPHRAIVEGRKVPKNPFLLQRGMQERVEQLIRREKKSLKPIEESEASVEAKKEKPAQPDLYCDICKTSVTCSEQMTMHLNGKKHLAKEKHHILKMMKGGPTANKSDPSAPQEADPKAAQDADLEAAQEADLEAAGTEAENASENKEQNVNEEDEYDWGNGSGTWEDNPQQTTDAV